MNAIVMTDKDGCIGVNNDQPLHLREDLMRFQCLTTDKIVICGSTTLQTFPKGEPLKQRETIILSSKLSPQQFSYITDRNITVYSNIQDVVMLQAYVDPKNMFVIGGASIYHQLINFIDNIYMTQVDTIFEGDNKAYFPMENLYNFEVKGSKHITDMDRNTRKSYETEFIHFQRSNDIIFSDF